MGKRKIGNLWEVIDLKQKETFLCIDLKSFYASVECVERGLDPFTTNLVVADPDRSVSTICLAITPAMKKLGIRNRCRIHEIPDHIEYIVAKPRMQLYMEYSARIYGIYLNYVAKEDIHVYSVDECFMDVTRYLSLYHLTAKEMAQKLMDAVMEETGITATAGIGTNLYLAKIAMDIVAKHIEDHIGMLDEISYREQLWGHKPLSDFWRIGSRTERKLAGYGIQTMGDADTYKTVYQVETVNQEHPNYQISRNVVVKEIEKESESPSADAEQSETKETEEDAEDSEKPSEIPTETPDVSEGNAAFDALVEQMTEQDTFDEGSGLALHDVMEQAANQGVDFEAMETGEVATFSAIAARDASVGSQQVTIEKGPIYRYADYGLGTYLTEPYYISYGSVRATAYCIQPAKPGPGSGTYTITKLADNQALAKVCYYGTDAAGEESYFANKHSDFSAGKRFILVHMAAAYAYGSSDAFYGTNATGQELAMDIYNYCVKKPEIREKSRV